MSVTDDYLTPAQLDEHVLEGRLRLGPVPGLGCAAVVDAGRVVAVDM